jgi:hypothetical protein
MGRSGTRSTIGAMHVGSGVMAYAVGRAITDGVQRAQDLAAEDHAHEIGQYYYRQRLAQRRAEAAAEADAAAARLNAARKRIHGN